VAGRERGVTLRVALEAASVDGDEDLLGRTLTNLVENAIRHSPPGTVVGITAARVGRATELRVVDAGPGIPVAMRERIFDPFVQLEHDAAASSRTGRGLGLAFCKLAVEAHGGTVWIEDANPGAVFALRIPDAE
jgi:two-component system, sensor histidine kinase and response regulator